MQVYRHRNTGSDLFVRLTYTNTPLLEKLGVHYVEEDPSISTRLKQREEWHPQSSALDLDLGPGGARMRSYEYTVDIDVVESRAFHWPWAAVKNNLPFAPRPTNRGHMLPYIPAPALHTGPPHPLSPQTSHR